MVDSKYLSGSNEKLTGNLTFKPGEYFVYSGMFKGKIKGICYCTCIDVGDVF